MSVGEPSRRHVGTYFLCAVLCGAAYVFNTLLYALEIKKKGYLKCFYRIFHFQIFIKLLVLLKLNWVIEFQHYNRIRGKLHIYENN